jgi:small subunit ribosomal protein S6
VLLSTKINSVLLFVAVNIRDNYELMVIIKPLLPEETRGEVQDRLLKLVKKAGGEITSTDVWGKRHLAYEIKGFDEGYYIIYKCELPAAAVAELNQALTLNPDIIRFLLIKEENL